MASGPYPYGSPSSAPAQSDSWAKLQILAANKGKSPSTVGGGDADTPGVDSSPLPPHIGRPSLPGTARPDDVPLEDKRTLLVRSIPQFLMNLAKLSSHFCQFGNVINVKVRREVVMLACLSGLTLCGCPRSCTRRALTRLFSLRITNPQIKRGEHSKQCVGISSSRCSAMPDPVWSDVGSELCVYHAGDVGAS